MNTKRYSARMYLQLPLRQWGAGNVYLLVFSSWKINIAENPIAVKGLKIRLGTISIPFHSYQQLIDPVFDIYSRSMFSPLALFGSFPTNICSVIDIRDHSSTTWTTFDPNRAYVNYTANICRETTQKWKVLCWTILIQKCLKFYVISW